VSVVSSRPRVRGVSLTGPAATVALGAGAALATVLVRSLSAAALAAYREGCKAREALECTKTMGSVAEVERRQRAGGITPAGRLSALPPTETLKLETALRLRDYAVGDAAAALSSGVERLSQERSLSEVRRASEELLSAVGERHQTLFLERLTDTCIRASCKAGFASVRTPRKGDVIRVIATNQAGQALVSEISIADEGDVSIATEAVGIRDGSCHDILDRFDAALEAEGVIAGPPRRSSTGGVCQLDASRAAVGELYTSAPRVPQDRTTGAEGSGEVPTQAKRHSAKGIIPQRSRS
jgi:hypothetical protein